MCVRVCMRARACALSRLMYFCVCVMCARAPRMRVCVRAYVCMWSCVCMRVCVWGGGIWVYIYTICRAC